MAIEDLEQVLDAHRTWLESEGQEGKRASLRRALLNEAYLQGADLRGADLREADLCEAIAWGTGFGNLDLSVVKGLETIHHMGHSTIGIDTIHGPTGSADGVMSGSGVGGTVRGTSSASPLAPRCSPNL